MYQNKKPYKKQEKIKNIIGLMLYLVHLQKLQKHLQPKNLCIDITYIDT